MPRLLAAAQAFSIAFSSEVDAGSREENASEQKDKPRSDLIRTRP
jgi:hypothetical protein